MSNIIAGDPAPTNPTGRDGFIVGLRELADWLDANPAAPAPYVQRISVPLIVNSLVVELAAHLGLTPVYDEEGNASVTVELGSLSYYAYGYVDFDETVKVSSERDARRWAEKQGLEITAPEGGESRG